MPTITVETEDQKSAAHRLIDDTKPPFSVQVIKGKKRSVEQNKLQRKWMNEVSMFLGDTTPEEVRGFCKLTMGVPILRAENEEFAQAYDEHVKPLPYHTKLAFMMEPLDFPVTRLMTTTQHAAYLDEVYKYWTARGAILTEPTP